MSPFRALWAGGSLLEVEFFSFFFMGKFKQKQTSSELGKAAEVSSALLLSWGSSPIVTLPLLSSPDLHILVESVIYFWLPRLKGFVFCVFLVKIHDEWSLLLGRLRT